jgi:hypothetical protein
MCFKEGILKIKQSILYPTYLLLYSAAAITIIILGNFFLGDHKLHGALNAAVFIQEAEVVKNPEIPVPEPGQRKKLVFEEKLSIGVSEGDENYMFGQSLYVNMDEEGCFFVTDWDRKHIRKFSPEGKYLTTIGRPGQGPGEFQNVWGPKFDTSGNLYVRDIANKKISFFSKSGDFIKGLNTPQDLGDVTILPNENYFTYKTESIEDPKVHKFMHIYGIYDADFNLIKEFEQVKQEIRQKENKTRAQFIAGILSDSAFKPYFVQEVTKDGTIYTGYAETYEIKIYSQKGDLQKIVTREYQPIKVSQTHKDYYFEVQSIDLLRRLPSNESFKDEIRKHMEYPKFLPAYSWFTMMDNGWLYVVVDVIEGDHALIDLFNEQRIYVGLFRSNLPAAQVNFKNGLAYAVVTVDDYKYIKTYTYEIENY